MTAATRSARLKPCGPLPAPPYSPIEDGEDETRAALILPMRKHGEVSPKATEGPHGSTETAAQAAVNQL